MLYIPFIKKNKLHEKSAYSFDFENMNQFSLLGQTQCQHLLLEFCGYNKLYKEAFNTTSAKRDRSNE